MVHSLAWGIPPSSLLTLELSEIEIQQLKNIYSAGQCVAWSSLTCRLDPVTVVLCEVEFPKCDMDANIRNIRSGKQVFQHGLCSPTGIGALVGQTFKDG